MTQVDHILALADRLTRQQRIALESRLVDRPGTIRTQIAAWAFMNRKALLEELPADLRPHADKFWGAVNRACRRNDRKPAKIAGCCRIALRQAKRALSR
jgi:hypothetical protein